MRTSYDLIHVTSFWLTSADHDHHLYRTPSLAKLINIDTVDLPVRLSIDTRIIPHIIHTALPSMFTLLPKDTASPITTERGIKDDVHVAKTLVDVAASTSIESDNRRTPILRHRPPIPNILRHRISGKEPNINPTTLPLHRINASPILIKPRSEVPRIASPDGAAVVAVVGIAVTLERNGTGGAIKVHCTPWGGVKGYAVGGLEVDAFDYVDFAGGGPVGAKHLLERQLGGLVS